MITSYIEFTNQSRAVYNYSVDVKTIGSWFWDAPPKENDIIHCAVYLDMVTNQDEACFNVLMVF